MKTLIVDAYRFAYRVSRAQTLSIIIAMIYVTILNMIVLCGFCLLLDGWIPTAFIQRLFISPYYFITGAAMFFLTALYSPSKKAIAKEAKKAKDYTFIIVYSLAALILFLYLQFGSKIVFNDKTINVKPRKRPSYTQSALPILPAGWQAVLKDHPDSLEA